MLKGQQHRSCEEKMQKLGVFDLLCILSIYIGASWEGVKKVGADFSQYYPMKGQEAMDVN